MREKIFQLVEDLIDTVDTDINPGESRSANFKSQKMVSKRISVSVNLVFVSLMAPIKSFGIPSRSLSRICFRNKPRIF
jgi:hypothetical protein